MRERILEFLNLSMIDSEVVVFLDILIIIGIAAVFGLFIYFVYNKTYKGVMYSSSFGITLIMMTLITSVVIYSVTANFMLSLGMVGALSIVRFRTVIKEPLDLAYLFWSITMGILVGAGFFVIATLGGLSIGIILFLFSKGKINSTPYMLVLSCGTELAENKAIEIISNNTKKFMIKAKTVVKGNIELTIEIRIKDSSTAFINTLLDLQDVKNASLVSYNGDYYM